MKNRAYHEGIKSSPNEGMFSQPMKVGLKTSNLADDAIEDMFTKEKLEKVVSEEHGDEQNNLTKDPVEEIYLETPKETSYDLVNNADIEGPVFVDVQEETGAEDLPSREMITDVVRSPSMCVKRKNKVREKRLTVKSNLETQAFKMTRLARDKFPQGKIGDTVIVRNQMLIEEVDLTKDLYKIGTKDGTLNQFYTPDQFTTCTKGAVASRAFHHLIFR